MKRLIIVAAPSCCGKTSFVRQLRNDKLQPIAEQLRMGNVADWEYKDGFFANNAMIMELRQRQVQRLILHWTIPHPSTKLKLRNFLLRNAYDKKSRLSLIKMAKNVTCLTLVADPITLIERVGYREERVMELRLEGRDSLARHKRKTKHIRALRAVYGDIEKVVLMYGKWFSFCEQIGVNQEYLVDVNNDPFLTPVSNWQTYIGEWRNPTTG